MIKLPRSSSYSAFELTREHQSIWPKSTFLRLNTRLSVALFDKEQASSIAQHELIGSYALVGIEVAQKKKNHQKDISAATPATLEEIFMFDAYFNTLCRQNNEVKVVVYTGLGVERQIKIILLLGCYLIMTCDVKVHEVISLFKAVDNLVGLEESECSLHHFWFALDSAKTLRWISFKETFDSQNYDSDCIAMDEYLHYARYQRFNWSARMTFSNTYFLREKNSTTPNQIP
jgi:hypothetical protein